MPMIPLPGGQDVRTLWKKFNERIQEPTAQRQVILVAVCIALLLDNMLYMVIVPIIPDYLSTNRLIPLRIGGKVVYEGEDSAVGLLFAIKAMVQLLVNPFSGAIIDRLGYDVPMMIGLTIMFFSTSLFACGRSYGVLFFARSLQGAGSAFADTGGLAMIADRFTEESERQKALGIALTFISFGSLCAPPFGGFLYEFCGKEVPFILLALVCLFDGFLVLIVMSTVRAQMKQAGISRPAEGTPIYVLLQDTDIAVCAGALVMANVSLAFLEPTISIWMQDTMAVEEWQIGMIWLPAFLPYVAGIYLTVRLSNRYPCYQWLLAATGLALTGTSCLLIPWCSSFWSLFLPISILCFGVATIDTAVLPTLGYIVDTRYVSVYGSIYAIADISYSMAYAFGPIIAGNIVETFGFTTLNVIIALSNLAYCPVLLLIRHIHEYKPFDSGQSTCNALTEASDKIDRHRAAANTLQQQNSEINSFSTKALPSSSLTSTQQYSNQQSNYPIDHPTKGYLPEDNPWGDDPRMGSKSGPISVNYNNKINNHSNNGYHPTTSVTSVDHIAVDIDDKLTATIIVFKKMCQSPVNSSSNCANQAIWFLFLV
uniref:Major facilitator superfamily (MFS) profile domain-containing protein n=1 Tax=Tetranychus urticae TaxID=32264 RepID=T1KRF4_TETUR